LERLAVRAPEILYADHHATTPVGPEVLEAMRPWLMGLAANPSSVHAPGRAAREAVERARTEAALALGALPEEIVFTSGGTESDTLGVLGGALAARERDAGRTQVAVTRAEHAAVREAARLTERFGFTAVELPVDGNGLTKKEAFEERIEARTALVSAILANNETGAINSSFSSLSELGHLRGAIVHTDAVQAVGKIPVDVRRLGADLLSLTAHKFGGPKGTGALFVKTGTRLSALFPGGGQEKGRRGGTENVAGIVGLGEAIRLATRRLAEESVRLAALRDRFEAGLSAAIPGIRFNAASARRLPAASSVVFPGADGETLLAALDLEGIAASAGSACQAGTTTPSRVLLACGLSPAEARGTLRFSFGSTTRETDIDRLLEVVPRVFERATEVVRA
jgi:cysteine desulfurase